MCHPVLRCVVPAPAPFSIGVLGSKQTLYCRLEDGELCIQLELGTQGDLSRLIKEHAATGMPEPMIWFVMHQAITGLLTLKLQSIMYAP